MAPQSPLLQAAVRGSLEFADGSSSTAVRASGGAGSSHVQESFAAIVDALQEQGSTTHLTYSTPGDALSLRFRLKQVLSDSLTSPLWSREVCAPSPSDGQRRPPKYPGNSIQDPLQWSNCTLNSGGRLAATVEGMGMAHDEVGPAPRCTSARSASMLGQMPHTRRQAEVCRVAHEQLSACLVPALQRHLLMLQEQQQAGNASGMPQASQQGRTRDGNGADITAWGCTDGTPIAQVQVDDGSAPLSGVQCGAPLASAEAAAVRDSTPLDGLEKLYRADETVPVVVAGGAGLERSCSSCLRTGVAPAGSPPCSRSSSCDSYGCHSECCGWDAVSDYYCAGSFVASDGFDSDRYGASSSASSSGASSFSASTSCSAGLMVPVGGAGAAGSLPRLQLRVPGLRSGPAACVFPQYVGREVRSDYEFGMLLGHGSFGLTSVVTERRSARPRAAKSIPKGRLLGNARALADVRREVMVMEHLAGHEGVVQLHGVYEDASSVHLVMELCTGGELLDDLARHGRYCERDAAVALAAVLRVLAYCHGRGVVHRDVKPENFLLVRHDEGTARGTDVNSAHSTGASTGAGASCSHRRRGRPLQLKASDFGVSTFLAEGGELTELVGTPYYIAPEVLARRYGREADVWSAGVIGYLLLSGRLPFTGATDRDVFESVLSAPVAFIGEPWDHVSGPAKDLLRAMLTRDPRKRPGAVQLLQHPWLRGACHEASSHSVC